jgi:formate C-acetyltransferase
VAKIPYADCQDGISFTANLTPNSLGKTREARTESLARALDALFRRGLFHINVNVLSRETLVDAMAHPERYPDLTVRVSGNAVPFFELTHEEQHDVIARTLHGQP